MTIKDLLSEDETIVKINKFDEKNILNYLEKFKDDYCVHNIEEIETVIKTGLFTKEYHHHYIVELYGGDNESGNWQKYFGILEKIFDKSKYQQTQIEKMWLIELVNDCPDDVHTAYIGIRVKD